MEDFKDSAGNKKSHENWAADAVRFIVNTNDNNSIGGSRNVIKNKIERKSMYEHGCLVACKYR